MKSMNHIVLIGNYKKDRQMSMQLFTDMLHEGYTQAGYQVTVWRPICFFAQFFNNTTTSAGKWFAYIDKWILFPMIIRIKRVLPKYDRKSTVFHVCDHSNAIYLQVLPRNRSLITCHDVLAIRGALGFKDAFCEASVFGVFLQKWILRNLLKAKKIAAVSEATFKQLQDLDGFQSSPERQWRVILNGFNGNFHQITEAEKKEFLKASNLLDKPFLLHVGSSLPRKNRKVLVSMLDKLSNTWNGYVCFAGEKIDSELQDYITLKGLNDKVISFESPNHKELLALYNTCEAFVFPSYSEGFGWPLVEAQSCGAVVIASSIEPMPEVSGAAAWHVHPDDFEGFANAFLKLQQDSNLKQQFIAKGFENIVRFDVNSRIKDYIELFKS